MLFLNIEIWTFINKIKVLILILENLYIKSFHIAQNHTRIKKLNEGWVGGFPYVARLLTYNKRSLQRSKYFCYTETELHKGLPRHPR